MNLGIVDPAASRRKPNEALSTMTQYSGYRIYPWVHSQINVPKTYQELKQAK
jgi:hypothetical protein